MIATLQEDVLHIIENFKEKVNPKFVATPQDLMKIKKMVQDNYCGRTNERGGDILYASVDYDGLKRNNVKDFSFSLKDYERWSIETLELLKAEFIARRNKYAIKREATKTIQLPIE